MSNYIQMRGPYGWFFIRDMESPRSRMCVTTSERRDAHQFAPNDAQSYALHFSAKYGAETRVIEASP
jgi:hypothetical protein